MNKMSPMLVINGDGKDAKIEILADFATMQSIEYHENGKVARIVFKSAAEIINIAAFIECHLTKRAPDVVESAASVSISTASEVSASKAESVTVGG